MNYFKIFLIFVVLVVFGACHINSNIKTADYIKIAPIDAFKTLYGVVKSLYSTNLSFQTEGKIVYLPYTKGDFIKKGEVIARLDGVLYGIKKREEEAKLKEYLVLYEKRKKHYDRLNILHKEGAISDNDWEEGFYQLQTTLQQIKIQKEKINYLEKEISYNTIIAPYDGYIADKFLDNGAYAKIGMPVVSYIGSSGLQAEIILDEDLVNKIALNQKVIVKILNKNYLGKISHISKTSIKQGGYLVKIELNNASKNIKEGMSASVQIDFNSPVCSLPLRAILSEEDDNFIYKIVDIKNGIGKIKKEKVVLGNMFDDKIEVLSGVKNGDLVIVNNLSDFHQYQKIKL